MKWSHLAGVGIVATAAIVGSAVLPGASAASGGPSSTYQNPDQPLRKLADRHDLNFGTAVNTTALAEDETYREIVETQFSSVTAENVMKWESLEPTQGEYTYEAADELVAFARKNRQVVHGHVLLWHNQNPAWLTEGVASGEITPAELREIVRKHVIETVRHFKGKVYQWDVVNEAFNEDGTLRETIFSQHLGPDYMADLFRWAHSADPKAKLYYNDYNIEDVNPKSDAVYALVKDFQKRGVPIHGVGVQAHHTVSYGPTTMRENLQRFADRRILTSVTEADVRMDLPSDSIKELAQAQVFSGMLEDCLFVTRCVSYTVWGFSDNYSWVPDVFEGQGAATIYTEEYQPKRAYTALQKVLALAGGTRHRG